VHRVPTSLVRRATRGGIGSKELTRDPTRPDLNEYANTTVVVITL